MSEKEYLDLLRRVQRRLRDLTGTKLPRLVAVTEGATPLCAPEIDEAFRRLWGEGHLALEVVSRIEDLGAAVPEPVRRAFLPALQGLDRLVGRTTELAGHVEKMRQDDAPEPPLQSGTAIANVLREEPPAWRTQQATARATDLISEFQLRWGVKVDSLSLRAVVVSNFANALPSTGLAAQDSLLAVQESLASTERAREVLENRLKEIQSEFSSAEKRLQDAVDNEAALQRGAREVEQSSRTAKEYEQGVLEIRDRLLKVEEDVTKARTAFNENRSQSDKLLRELERASAATDKQAERLDELLASGDEITKKAESFLPGATAAGLATAFANEKERAEKALKAFWWRLPLAFFLLVVGVWLAVGMPVPAWLKIGNAPDSATGWGFVSLLIMRGVVLLPGLVLVTHFLRRQKMLEQSRQAYAHKEAVARSLEGFRKVMEDHGVEAARGALYEILAKPPILKEQRERDGGSMRRKVLENIQDRASDTKGNHS